MWEKIANYKGIIISLMLGIVAMAIITLAEKYLAVGTSKTVIIDISSALLAIAVISFAFDLFLRKEMINLVVERVRLSREVIRVGLDGLRIGRDYLELRKFVNESEKNVCILGMTAQSPIINCRDEIREALAKRRVEVNLLICKEESCGVKERENEQGTSGRFSSEIRDAEKLLQDVTHEIEISNHSRKAFGKLEIRQYHRLPFCSLYIFDWQKCLYIPYLFKIRGANSLVFRFSQTKNGGAFVILKTHFQKLWDDANENVVFSWPS